MLISTTLKLENINKLLLESRVEVIITHKDKIYPIYLQENDDFKKLREIIKTNLNYTKINQFEIYCGKYHLNDLFDDLAVKKLNHYFLNNNYIVEPSNEKDPFTLEKPNLNLNYLINLHKETVDNYLSIYDVEDYMKVCLNDMSILAENLAKMYEDICREEEYLKKHGLLHLHDKLFAQVEEEKLKVQNKENYLSDCFVKILEMKNLEKQAVETVKENKKLVLAIFNNSIKIDNKRKEIHNITTRQSTLVKKREHEAKLLENYIVSKKRVTVIEYIKLRFFRIYKHSVIMKIFNEKNIIAYKPTEGEGKIEVKKIYDTCNFESHFLTQVKRDEFYLNFKEKLLIAIKHSVFLFDYKTSIMEKIKDLAEDHKGGSFIYVPYSNSIYCISGLMSVLTERLKLTKNFEINNEANWEPVNKLIYPRSYYSSYVQNDCRIYIILGFDLWDNEYLTTVDRYDTSAPSEEGWKNIKLKGEKVPKLSFAACIPCSDDEVYIIGGKDENHIENTFLYLYDVRNDTIEDSNMRMPINSLDDDSKNLFYQENCFVTLRPENDDFEKAFLLALFDSKNYLHLVNIKNFDYSYVSHDIPMEYQIENDDSDRENVDEEEMYRETEKFKNASTTKTLK